MQRLGTAAMLLALVLVVHPQKSKPAHADENNGVIQGTVTYEDGKPVRGATAYAHPLGRPILAIIPHADSDETGHYALRIPYSWFGKFAVAAKKEDEGYPDMTNQFYSDGKFQTVALSASHPDATVIIRLGPKAGILVGTVADSVTNAALNPCVEFRRAKSSNFLEGTGLVNAKYRVLVPSNADILMKVWYSGHKPWYYPGTTQTVQSRPLNLKPGETMAIDIRLEPDPNVPQSGCGMPVGTVVNP